MIKAYTRMNLNFRKLTALMMVAVILLFSINVAHEVEEATLPASHKISIGVLNSEGTTHCPVCPIEHHGTNHDHSNYDHHNYTSLAYQNASLSPVPVITVLAAFEQFRALPEVYQDIFIPPQSSLA